MNYFFITGTSQGLGNALTKALLSLPDAEVTGIGRHNTIHHDRYKHIYFDLSDPEKLARQAKNLFPPLKEAEKIVLINNAGVLGEIGHAGKISNESLIRTLNINTIAPAILSNEFIRQYLTCANCHKLIINVSSGAGKKPTDGWSAYCASKAGLDMFSEVVAVEKQKDKNNLKVFSVAPGIVDTPMQDQIRHVEKKDFSRVEEFIEYKKENMLVSPEKVARKFLVLIENEDQFHEPLLSVRTL